MVGKGEGFVEPAVDWLDISEDDWSEIKHDELFKGQRPFFFYSACYCHPG